MTAPLPPSDPMKSEPGLNNAWWHALAIALGVALVATVAVFGAVGCGADDDALQPGDGVDVVTVQVDGVAVQCVTFRRSAGVAIDCLEGSR